MSVKVFKNEKEVVDEFIKRYDHLREILNRFPNSFSLYYHKEKGCWVSEINIGELEELVSLELSQTS